MGPPGRPEEIRDYSAGFSNVDHHFAGKLTTRPPSDAELEALAPQKRKGKVSGVRTFTLEELVFRRLPRPAR